MSSEPKEDKATMDPREAVDRSCRGPVLFLAFSAVAWLLVYSLFALLAGVKVHASGMMADSAWLAYGRIQPASQLALQFGFLVQLGLAVSAWILSHRGKTVLVDGGYLIFGGMLWNAGVTLGFLGILAGNASGLEGLQMPGKVLPLLFFGFVLVGLSLVQTNNRRTDEEMSPAQWFLFAATLWLPWVLAGSYLLIHFFNAKGVVRGGQHRRLVVHPEFCQGLPDVRWVGHAVSLSVRLEWSPTGGARLRTACVLADAAVWLGRWREPGRAGARLAAGAEHGDGCLLFLRRDRGVGESHANDQRRFRRG